MGIKEVTSTSPLRPWGPRAQHRRVHLPSAPPPNGGMSLQVKAAGIHTTENQGGERCTENRGSPRVQQVKVGPPPHPGWERRPPELHAGTGPAHTGLGRECLNSWGEGRVQRYVRGRLGSRISAALAYQQRFFF